MDLLQKLTEAEKDLEKGIKPIPAKKVFSKLKAKHFWNKRKTEVSLFNSKKITPEFLIPRSYRRQLMAGGVLRVEL